MTCFITLDELEKEIAYLREQNQKMIHELSQVVDENSVLREELAGERQRRRKAIEGAGHEVPEKNDGPSGEKGDKFCLN